MDLGKSEFFHCSSHLFKINCPTIGNMKNKLLGFFFLEGNDLYIVKFDELSLVKHKLYVPHLRGRVYSGQTKSQ